MSALRARSGTQTPEKYEPLSSGALATIRGRRAELAAELEEADRIPLQLERTLRRIEDLLAVVDGRTVWSFESTEDAWRHQLLSELVDRLQTFADPENGTVVSVCERLKFASTLMERTVGDYASAWQEVADGIRNSGRYPTLEDRPFETAGRADPARRPIRSRVCSSFCTWLLIRGLFRNETMMDASSCMARSGSSWSFCREVHAHSELRTRIRAHRTTTRTPSKRTAPSKKSNSSPSSSPSTN